MTLLSQPQSKEFVFPLYQEEFIDWFVKSGNTDAAAKKYIRHFRNIYERVLKPYWTESAMIFYSNAVDRSHNQESINEQDVPDIDGFLEDIQSIMELELLPSLSPTFSIAVLCLERAQEDDNLNISQSTFNQWKSAFNSYGEFIKYLHEKRIRESLIDNSDENCEIQPRSLILPFIDEFDEWQKKQPYMGSRSKSNYISMLKDLHQKEFPAIDPVHASPFDLMMPFVPDQVYIAVDILQKYADILRSERGRIEHFSALNKYIEFLNDMFGNKVNNTIENVTTLLPVALKYDLTSFKIKTYGIADLRAHIRKKFHEFKLKFKKDPSHQGITQEDFAKILVMTENGFKKFSDVENMVLMPWQEFTAIRLNNDEAFEVFSPNNEDEIVRAVVRTLDDLEVKIWRSWLVLSVKDYKKYPECKYIK